MEKYLIHSNELHLIDAGKIHQAVEKMVESLDLAAGSTSNFDLYQVVESYFRIYLPGTFVEKCRHQQMPFICYYY